LIAKKDTGSKAEGGIENLAFNVYITLLSRKILQCKKQWLSSRDGMNIIKNKNV
jgi:hypothetical protein